MKGYTGQSPKKGASVLMECGAWLCSTCKSSGSPSVVSDREAGCKREKGGRRRERRGQERREERGEGRGRNEKSREERREEGVGEREEMRASLHSHD